MSLKRTVKPPLAAVYVVRVSGNPPENISSAFVPSTACNASASAETFW